jgi:hypothetical protein
MRISEKYGVNPMLVQCFFCGEGNEEIALLGYLPVDKEVPRHGYLDFNPCNKCKANMALGITLMESADGKTPTGPWLVITEEATKRLIKSEDMLKQILNKRKAFIDHSILVMLMKDIKE